MPTFVGDPAATGSTPPPAPDPTPPPPPPPPDDIGLEQAYYVSATGDDGDDGSELNPFATIQHVLDLPPLPGTGIVVKGGTPLSGVGNRAFSLTNGLSGEAGAPIRLMGAPGEDAQIDLDGHGFFISSVLPISHWRWESLELLNATQSGNGVLTISAASGLCDDLTFYRLVFHKVPPGGNDTPVLYFGSRCGDRLVDSCTYIGPGYAGDLNADAGGIQTDHALQSGGLLTIRGCIFDAMIKGIQIYGDDADARVVIEHCTFKDCGANIEVVHYATAQVRNNAGTTALAGSAENLFDSGEGTLSADHNFWAQTFDTDYTLLPGNTGLNAASDGTDAGAIDSGT